MSTYSAIEVELKPRGFVLNRLTSMGYTPADIHGKKIIYLTNKVYSEKERTEIFDLSNNGRDPRNIPRNKIHVHGYFNYIKKLRPAATSNLESQDKITAWLNREKAFNTPYPSLIYIPSLMKKGYSVYVIELRQIVSDIRAFQNENPNYELNSRCFYVGQTSKTPEERFLQHLNDPQLGSQWVRNHRISVEFNTAHQTEWAEKTVQLPHSNLTYAQSLHYEREYAIQLKSRGFGAWFG